MALFLITGSAGAGKTTVCQALKAKGYEAYDVDVDGLAKWQHNVTGYIHPKSSISQAQRTPEFIVEHSWNVPRQEIEALAKEAINKPIFLCGSMTNEAQLRDLFAIAFALHIDEATLTQRLATRTSGDWGKQPHELQQVLDYYRTIYDAYRSLSYIIIDTSQPLETVVAEIITATEGYKPAA